jgi:hypothetical protein
MSLSSSHQHARHLLLSVPSSRRVTRDAQRIACRGRLRHHAGIAAERHPWAPAW